MMSNTPPKKNKPKDKIKLHKQNKKTHPTPKKNTSQHVEM
jgi:hypothetical protein